MTRRNVLFEPKLIEQQSLHRHPLAHHHRILRCKNPQRGNHTRRPTTRGFSTKSARSRHVSRSPKTSLRYPRVVSGVECIFPNPRCSSSPPTSFLRSSTFQELRL